MKRVYKAKFSKKTDNRGSFLKLLSSKDNNTFFKQNNISEVNLSINKKKGTIRGLHYQIGHFKEKKIIFCLSGKIYDVAININKKSKNYGEVSKNIIDDSNNFLIVPEDYAHGFQTLKDNTTLLYLHSKPYIKKFEKTIHPLQNEFKIKWPLRNITISKKDKNSL